MHTARNFLYSRSLLFIHTCYLFNIHGYLLNRTGQLSKNCKGIGKKNIPVANRHRGPIHCTGCFLGLFLKVAYHIGYLFSRLPGLKGKGFHLCSNNCKPSSHFTGPCSFNRRIQGKKVGLIGNVGYQPDNLIDLFHLTLYVTNEMISFFCTGYNQTHPMLSLFCKF
ncbi:MAG: hypothetical protein BWY45_03377 [Euryarchaeota archaeon ADurb.Bin294]|nr:MAG: hypothetical protein BWY45_03377 [Euryarchaeota archaeon ADurb.Bin294]